MERERGIDRQEQTDVQDPPKTDCFDEAPVMEALDPQSECKTAPGADAIPRSLPEEDGDSATRNSCNSTREDEHAAKGLTWRIDCRKDAESEDEDDAYERQSIETNEKKRSPMNRTS